MTGAIYEPAEGQSNLQEVATALEAVAARALLLTPSADMVAACSGASMVARRAANPLAGLRDALVWAGPEDLILLAADLVRPDAELLRYLCHVKAGHEAVLPLSGPDEPQPYCAIYSPRCLRRVTSLLGSGEVELTQLPLLLETLYVTPEELAKFGEPRELLRRM